MTVKQLYSNALEQYEAKNYDAALKFLDDMKKIAPNFKSALYLEAAIWKNLNNSVKEYYALEKILPLLDFSSPEGRNFAAEIFIHIANACGNLGLAAEGMEFALLSEKMNNDNQSGYNIINSAVFHMNYLENRSPADFRVLYDKNKKYFTNIVPYPKKFYSHAKIRVGFLSSHFYFHAIVAWSWSLLTNLNKNLFSTYFYSNAKASDNVTADLRKACDNWRDISALTDEAAAKLIRDDEIDILFDFDGHTENNRLRVAAYRPATIQISGVGYMNSTGLDCFDYFLSDVYCAGNDSAMSEYFTEKIIKLPRTHICYEPKIKPEVNAFPPCFKKGFVTFGNFSHLGKITDSILSAWKKIFDAVPCSRLILKNRILSNDVGKNFANNRLKEFGFDITRVEMRPYTDNWLLDYNDVDIALDTFPYTGGVTTCEALYMGVPVISLYGDRHGTRFGLSILSNVGLEELAVDSYDEYINRAVGLASDWELLKILRKNLRNMIKKSPLMDSESYLRDIQTVFIQILSDERKIFQKS